MSETPNNSPHESFEERAKNNSLGWLKFVGKAHPKSTIYIQCHCGEMATPVSDPDHGSEFLCSNHGVIAFAQAGTDLNSEALRYVRMR